MNDEEYMRLAVELAKKGYGETNPNPVVGSVIVKNGEIIGRGYHTRYGCPHAEVEALNSCTKDPSGATMYVTLEPCCHYGKNPPCTSAIIQNKISRVVVGSGDPNPLVASQGIKILKDNGITVVEHILEEECTKLNEVFFHYIKNKTPYVVMKYAMTLDGKIATKTGKSRWITSDKARESVHMDRHRYMGIMVGVNTVLNDDPMLNCRIEGKKSPIRIICDSNLRTPITSNVVKTAGKYKTIIATLCDDEKRVEEYIKKGCQIIKQDRKLSKDGGNPRIDLQKLMKDLGESGIDSILLEGGGTLNYSALESKIVNKVKCYIAPKIFGGEEAKTPVAGAGIDSPSDAFVLKKPIIHSFGDDIMLESEVVYCSRA